MKNFVVVVDTQYDFMMPDGILYVKGAEETIVPIVEYLASLTPDTTVGVLFTFDTHTREQYEGSPESKMFPIHCELGTLGHKNIINDRLLDRGEALDNQPYIHKYFLHKEVFNMWESTLVNGPYSLEKFEYFLEKRVRDEVEIIDIIGVALNFCVKQAVDGFLERGFKVRLHTSMTRGIDTGKIGDLDARVLYAGEITLGKVIVVD